MEGLRTFQGTETGKSVDFIWKHGHLMYGLAL